MNNDIVVKIDEVEFYENDFEIAIAEACREYDIEDLLKEGQRRWKFVLKYVGKKVFGDSRILRDKNIVWLEGNRIPTNNNRLAYDIVDVLCEYYMSLSDRYNKLISAEAFSLFLGISRDTIGTWGEDESSSTRFHIYKKLKDFRLECIKDNSYDNGNVTGTMYVGNVEYGTNLPGVSEHKPRQRLISREEMGLAPPEETPALPGEGENT